MLVTLNILAAFVSVDYGILYNALSKPFRRIKPCTRTLPWILDFVSRPVVVVNFIRSVVGLLQGSVLGSHANVRCAEDVFIVLERGRGLYRSIVLRAAWPAAANWRRRRHQNRSRLDIALLLVCGKTAAARRGKNKTSHGLGAVLTRRELCNERNICVASIDA